MCGKFLHVNFTVLHRYKLFLTSHLFSLIVNLLHLAFIDVINLLLQIEFILVWVHYYNLIINPKC